MGLTNCLQAFFLGGAELDKTTRGKTPRFRARKSYTYVVWLFTILSKKPCHPEIIYTWISKEIVSLHGLDMFCQFEPRFREFDVVVTSVVRKFPGKRLHIQFVKLEPRVGRTHQQFPACRSEQTESRCLDH
jgi:hypothetical protein